MPSKGRNKCKTILAFVPNVKQKEGARMKEIASHFYSNLSRKVLNETDFYLLLLLILPKLQSLSFLYVL